MAALAMALSLLLPATLEDRSRDALTRWRTQHTPLPGVLVVDISEHALQAIGPWPWRRALLADLVEQLLGPLGARAVALDMVLPEAADAAGDARLASIAAHGPLTLAHVLDFEQRPVPIRIGTQAGALAAGDAAQSAQSVQSALAAQATGYVANHAGLAQARCVGHIGVTPDGDGVLRRVHLRAQAGERLYPTLSLAMLGCVDAPAAARAEAALRASADAAQGHWRIPFRQGVEAFATVPADAVLQGRVAREQVAGRLVLIGSSAVGLSDYIATPMQPVTAGVLVHAQVLSELLQPPAPGLLLGRQASLAATLLAALAGCALIAWGLARRTSLGLALTALAMALWLAAAAWAFGEGASLPVLAPLAALAAFTACWTSLEFAQARRLSRQALNTLSHYVAAPVLKLLVRQGLQRSLIPARREITVLVADMAGYTRLTASSTLEDSARLTTEFLEAITPAVLDSGGTLDRYTGDGLIAFWGAPLARADHAQCAIDAAQAMLAAVQRLNRARQARGEPALSMRAGIESGEALVGDLGSSKRGVYTAVGTCINLASRLQDLARDIGEVVVVGPQAQARMHARLRPVGQHTPRGMSEAIEVFALET